MADSKLATFLSTNKLNSDRILAVSHKLETLTADDRKIKLAQRRAKGEGDKAGPKPEGKPRSGRPVSPRALSAAVAGTAVSGPAKQRILRAVNYLLAQKKKDAVDLRTLF
jgi:hypothetical protein